LDYLIIIIRDLSVCLYVIDNIDYYKFMVLYFIDVFYVKILYLN
jgi:hypothetical protein